MGFKCGIVGLPNVGKSTLFNALTQTAAAQAANYPFCTIEPNVGDVGVPDERLEKLAIDSFGPITWMKKADPRFGPLCDGIGLTEYWRRRGVQPDYMKTER